MTHQIAMRRATVLAVLAALTAACSGPGSPETGAAAPVPAPPTTAAPPSPSPPAAPPTTVAKTTTAPASDDMLEQIDAAIAEFMTANGVPGVTAAVLLPGDGGAPVELLTAAGLSDIVAEDAADPGDHYRFGSITKPMTSVIILQLVDEGLIDLDAPVATYLGAGWAEGYVLDGVDYGDLVTIRQILDHTDGFAEFAFDVEFYIQSSLRLETPYEPEEIVTWAVNRGPQYVPGTDYLYNTVGHVVAGLVIEAVTGQAAHEVMRTRIFDPVGADDTYLAPAELPPNDDVAGYVQGELKAAIDLLPGYAPYKADSAVGTFYDVTVSPQGVTRSAGWTGGGIEAQADDIARIFRSMFTGALSDEMLDEFLTTPEFSNYGLGITVGEFDGSPAYSHGGGVPGFRSHAVHLPESDVTVVLSANLIPIDPDISSLGDTILGIVLTAVP
ncbi:MAG: serine hydrolase domain-containing protein [Ilumatobacteraceae bacterium]